MAPNSWQFCARSDGIVTRGVHDMATNTSAETKKLEDKLHALRGVHDVATDTSSETRKLEGKLDAPLNLVTQLAANQKAASVARVCGIRSSNDHHTSQFWARNDVIVIRGVHDVVIDTSAETRKLECKLDALVNLVTQLAAKQKPVSFARQFSARNGVIVIRGVHDVATDTSAETRKLEGKLDTLVNLVTQLAANQKSVSIARQTTTAVETWHLIEKITPNSSQFGARNEAFVIIGVHDVATDTSAETRKLEGKLYALVNLVTQLAANQKPASIARVCDIRYSNDHHTSVCPSSQSNLEWMSILRLML
ncbi:hypothetical protein Fmac_021014 [Flemingia macrophylla]|uniref:Uncharacterized protein n=1 Tax=Flemingia macrophylla TaxID=520843 RepID=A0ABD1LVW5_9FABA